jgi:hypothetical protein
MGTTKTVKRMDANGNFQDTKQTKVATVGKRKLYEETPIYGKRKAGKSPVGMGGTGGGGKSVTGTSKGKKTDSIGNGAGCALTGDCKKPKRKRIR